jgi:hypothetical protein
MTIKCEEPLPPNVIEIKVECMSVQLFLRKATFISQDFLSVQVLGNLLKENFPSKKNVYILIERKPIERKLSYQKELIVSLKENFPSKKNFELFSALILP